MAEINQVDLEQLLNCALCPNMCRCECPVLQVLGREAVAPAGKARIAAMARQEQLAWNEPLLEAAANCLGCRGCTTLCPFPELNLCDELLFSRLDAAKSGITLPAWAPYLSNLKKYGSPYGQKASDAPASARKGEALFFAGCTSLANNQKAVEASLKLFEQAGIAYAMIDEDCCGYPAETWGDLELAVQLAKENRRKMAETGARVLITTCPECWMTFSDRYPAWGQQLDLEIIDGPTYFLRLIREGRLQPGAVDRSVISYHDPCIWARTAQKTEEPREILAAIPGLTIKEPFAAGENTRCCGGGRMFQLSFPQTAAAIARRRLEEFPEETLIVTACPFCREGLMQEDRRVVELVELLAEACRKKREE